jgi:hypothetical protein
MFCSNCGTQLTDKAQFCANCGTKLGIAEAPVPLDPVCASCGEELVPGNRFCIKCGTPTVPAESQTAYSPQQGAYQPPPPITARGISAGDTNEVLLKYTLMNPYFSSRDVNGKVILADDMFKKPKSATAYEVAGAVLGGVMGGLTASQFGILVQLYKNRICFTRLTPLLKPTDSRLEINGSAIASTTQADSFMNKSITINLRSGEQYSIEAPKKHRERVVSLLNGMITR